ncbi:hypothetical protein BH18ACI4_BH18ACI4_27030 [soil metagenome]
MEQTNTVSRQGVPPKRRKACENERFTPKRPPFEATTCPLLIEIHPTLEVLRQFAALQGVYLFYASFEFHPGATA